MQRRQFLAASLATSALALTGRNSAQAQPGRAREFYQLRRYRLQIGPQMALTEKYFSSALFPALGRMNLGPMGAFALDIGPETPAYYLVIPGASVETLAMLDVKLADDKEFLDAAGPFWNATAGSPAFQRVEITLLQAFAGWPKLTPPPASATKGKRIFQLRTYESPSNGEHLRTIERFHSGEFDLFLKVGFHPVFFGDALIGPRLPNIVYMLSMDDLGELAAKWAAFRSDPAWKKLSTSPHFAFDPIVDNIGNLVLNPLDCSQV